MGKIFKSVADAALRSVDGEICQQCERPQVPAYRYTGEIIDPRKAADTQLAEEEPEVHYLCADCIHGGNVQRTDTWAVEHTIQRFAADPQKAWREFHLLPDAPLFLQGKLDWPFCCNTWCEFVACPTSLQELFAVQQSHQYWENGPAAKPRDFHSGGPPESMREISLFACASCTNRYYTDQYS